jgi:hypothetical protein
MNFKILVTALAASAALLAACQPAPSAAKVEKIAASDAITTAATITEVHDAGYPMFAVTAAIPDQAAPLELLLNAEEADLSGATPEAFVGKTVTLSYTNKPEHNLTDVRIGGTSLLQGGPAQVDPKWSVVTGVLSGAEAVTASDLPGRIEISAADGQKISFDYFVGPELTAVNEKEVTAYYVTQDTARITSLKLNAP